MQTNEVKILTPKEIWELPKFNAFEGMTEEEIKEYDFRLEQIEKAEELGRRELIFRNSGLGELYWNCDLKNFETNYPMQKEMLNSARNFYQKVKSGNMANLVLLGDAGRGKTTLASGLIHELNRTIKKNEFGFNIYFSVWYITSKDLCDVMQKTKSFNYNKTWDKILNDFARYDILVVDEIGKATDKFEFEVLFSVLDKRMQLKKSNIFISNLDYDTFVNGFSDYGMSRLNIGGSLDLVKIDGVPDLRQRENT